MIIFIPQHWQTIATFAHPILSKATFIFAFYAGYLGVQYRKAQRSDGEVMN